MCRDGNADDCSARMMIHSRNLDPNFWAEAVNADLHFLNRTGTSTVCTVFLSEISTAGVEIEFKLQIQGKIKLKNVGKSHEQGMPREFETPRKPGTPEQGNGSKCNIDKKNIIEGRL